MNTKERITEPHCQVTNVLLPCRKGEELELNREAKWIAKEQKVSIEFGEQGPSADVKNNRIFLPYDIKDANALMSRLPNVNLTLEKRLK